jgi:Holliday junction resolvase-like predicted endonuclease
VNDISPGLARAVHHAVIELETSRFVILGRRWRSGGHALELVAAVPGRVLIAVDVQPPGTGDPERDLADLGEERTGELRDAAQAWNAAHGGRHEQIRVDVIGRAGDGSASWRSSTSGRRAEMAAACEYGLAMARAARRPRLRPAHRAVGARHRVAAAGMLPVDRHRRGTGRDRLRQPGGRRDRGRRVDHDLRRHARHRRGRPTRTSAPWMPAGRRSRCWPAGPDMDYPAGHAELLDAIAADGAVVSEMPPGFLASQARFLARNPSSRRWPSGPSSWRPPPAAGR